MPSLINFAQMDLRGAFDFAIMIEEDAQIRYEQLSRIVGTDAGGVGDVFRMMARNEAKHRTDLEARRRVMFAKEAPRIEISVMDEGIEQPDVDDDDLPRTAHEALELCLGAERRAYEFYRDAVAHIRDASVRAFFQELMEEEQEHQDLLRAKIAALGARAGAK